MFPLDLLADLPQPRDDEPSSLRRDIADELADHLQCAFRREVLKDGDREAAQRRALDRFGDPKQLARRLWRQAMWSRIMKQRIVSGLQWTVALTAMLIAGAVFWQQSQLLAELRQGRQEEAAQRQALAAKLDQLQVQAGVPVQVDPVPDRLSDPYESSPAPTAPQADINFDPNKPPTYGAPPAEVRAPNSPFPPPALVLPLGTEPPAELRAPNSPPDIDRGPPVLTLKFVQETEQGPAVIPASVYLVSSDGMTHEGEPTVPFLAGALPRYPDGQTVIADTVRESTVDFKIVFRSLEPDNYQLHVKLAGGEQCQRSMLVRDAKPREMTILCPAPRNKKAPVPITIKPLPEKLQQKKFEVSLNLWVAPVELGQARWITPNLPRQTISFDSQTGLAMAIEVSNQEGPQHVDLKDLPADERRVFLPVGPVRYQFRVCERETREGTLFYWPDSQIEESGLKHTVEADEAAWELELPQEVVDQIVKELDADGNSPPHVQIDPYAR